MSQDRSSPDRRSLPEIGEETAAASLLHASFSDAFERCFGRVYAYVSRRTHDRKSMERIVSAVLSANLDLLIDRRDEGQEVRRLKTSADRLIALESARRMPGRRAGSAA